MVVAYLDAWHEHRCFLQVMAQAMQRAKEEENVQLLKQLQVRSWTHVALPVDCTVAVPY